VEEVEQDVAGEVGLGERVERAPLEVAPARRAQVAAPRRHQPCGEGVRGAEAAPPGERAERAPVVEPARQPGAVGAQQAQEVGLVVGQPLGHDPLRRGQPVAAGAARRVAVRGVRRGRRREREPGERREGGDEERAQEGRHAPMVRPGRPRHRDPEVAHRATSARAAPRTGARAPPPP
jgi:hypothetical protein